MSSGRRGRRGEEAGLSDADLGIKTRRRSESFSADDEDMLAEIDAAVGNPPSSGSSSAPAGARASSGPPKAAAGQLSHRTLAIIGMKEGGVAGMRPPAAPVTQADLEEAALAEEERRTLVASVIRRPVSPSAPGADAKDRSMPVKILMLGDGGVGKTSLLLRYAENTFSANMMPTAGVAYKSEMLEIQEQRVKFQIWDTAGQDRFHVITQAYYKGAHGICLVYDASQKDGASFQNIQYWMESIATHASQHVFKMLVANKVDLPRGAVAQEEGQAAAEHFGLPYFECSAKTGANVEHMFHSAAAEIVKAQVARAAAKVAATTPDKGTAAAAAAVSPPQVTAKQVKHIKPGKKGPCVIQ